MSICDTTAFVFCKSPFKTLQPWYNAELNFLSSKVSASGQYMDVSKQAAEFCQ